MQNRSITTRSGYRRVAKFFNINKLTNLLGECNVKGLCVNILGANLPKKLYNMQIRSKIGIHNIFHGSEVFAAPSRWPVAS